MNQQFSALVTNALVDDTYMREQLRRSHRRAAMKIVAEMPDDLDEALSILDMARQAVTRLLSEDPAPAVQTEAA